MTLCGTNSSVMVNKTKLKLNLTGVRHKFQQGSYSLCILNGLTVSLSTIPAVEWTTVDNESVVSKQKFCVSGSF